MTSLELTLLLGPIFGFGLLVAYLTKNDRITANSIKEIEQQPVNRVISLIRIIAGPVFVLLLINNLFGAGLLLISGAIFFFQDKLLPNVYWIRGFAAKAIGLVYVFLGLSLAYQHAFVA